MALVKLVGKKHSRPGNAGLGADTRRLRSDVKALLRSIEVIRVPFREDSQTEEYIAFIETSIAAFESKRGKLSRDLMGMWVDARLALRGRVKQALKPYIFPNGCRVSAAELKASKALPVLVAPEFFLYKEQLYQAEPSLSVADVHALLTESENRKRIQLEKAHALLAMRRQLDQKTRREPIPHDAKLLVWQRDHGRCAECESQKELEFDHIIPLKLGGSNTARNLQLLCSSCNRRKGASLG